MKLLIIDDDDDIRDSLRVTLRFQWPEATVLEAPNGESGIALAEKEVPDVIILDVMLPDIDGFEVCSRLRQVIVSPILMLSVASRTADKVDALERGADDYLVKPFNQIELMARIKALLRRAGPSQSPSSDNAVLQVDDIQLDRKTRIVSHGNAHAKLTTKEEALLNILMRNRGRTVPRRALLASVWGPDLATETNYLKLFIHTIRRKLETVDCPPGTISTDRGVGYRFNGSSDLDDE
ncbi:MAG: response regulator transcription factor [SAR202 cluster bacterium]|jgi:DNA-binding response OmpR family regulator|nr:response regulator transcription factor [SAR202 cluster bacterium]